MENRAPGARDARKDGRQMMNGIGWVRRVAKAEHVYRGLFVGLLAAALISGCASVSSVEPVGERPRELSPNEWEGTWIHKDHSVMIKISDKQKGLLRVAWVEEKGGGFKLESYEVEMRESGEWLFGNVKENSASSPYYWALVRKDEGQMTVWIPEPEQFTKLIQAGLLRGKTEKGGSVILEKLTSEDLKVILSGNKGIFFDWKRPLVFFRVGK